MIFESGGRKNYTAVVGANGSLPKLHVSITLYIPVHFILRGKLAGLYQTAEGDGELVLVKELRGVRMRRSAEWTLPRYLHMQFSVAGETVTLQLVRNTDIDTNIPFTFAGNKDKTTYIPDRNVRSRLQADAY